jgi:hypothetical protein
MTPTISFKETNMNTITQIRLVISQPMIAKAPSEWDFPNDEAIPHSVAFVEKAANACFSLIGKPREEIIPHLTPGEKQCQYCKAKVDCPAIVQTITAATDGEFKVLDEPTPFSNEALAKLYHQTKLIRKWCDAVDQKVVDKVMSGEMGEEHGLKVVAGKDGNRTWTDAAVVEAELKSMRLKQEQMYDYKLISPTTAEKVLADNPRKWKKISELIYRPSGGKVVVPVEDKRPAINVKPTAEGFESAVDADDDLV